MKNTAFRTIIHLAYVILIVFWIFVSAVMYNNWQDEIESGQNCSGQISHLQKVNRELTENELRAYENSLELVRSVIETNETSNRIVREYNYISTGLLLHEVETDHWYDVEKDLVELVNLKREQNGR